MDLPHEFDPNIFFDVPAPFTRLPAFRLSVSSKDQLQQNEAFRKKLQGVSSFHLQIRGDGLFLRLIPAEKGDLTFSPHGVRAHRPLGNILRERGLEPPVSYKMTWDDQNQYWVGKFEGAHTPPPVKLHRKRKGKTQQAAP